MAVYRPVYTNFWTDTKVAEQFDTADITFWLYLLTNPLTNTLGCYEVPKSVISFQTKIDMDDIKRKLLKFQHEYNLIKFDEKTNEILIENWTKYNWLNSFKTFLRVKSELENIKSNMLKKELMAKLSEIYGSFIKESDGAYMGHIRGSRNKQEQEQDINKNKNKIFKEKKQEEKDTSSSACHSTSSLISEIVKYLNEKTGKSYRENAVKTIDSIKARLKEGYKLEDFIKVINIKSAEWLNTDNDLYLRPETLFSNKFDGYLNQKTISKTTNKDSNATHTNQNQLKGLAIAPE